MIRFVLVRIVRCLEIVVSDILNGLVILVMVILFFSNIVRMLWWVGLVKVLKMLLSDVIGGILFLLVV